MVVAGYCYQGKLPLIKVDPKTKINSLYYQKDVLEPIFRREIPRLYGDDSKNVWFHQDKASSHTSRSTSSFLEELTRETKINVIPFSSIPVKSPDASPMDFCAFGMLKRALGNCRATTLNGLWKICKREWQRIDPTILRRSLLSWKVRCRAIAKNKGYHIEHMKEKKLRLVIFL